MLMKLTTGVNFINILLAHFLYERVLLSFSLIKVWFCIFLAKEYWHNIAAHKMLMKLTTAVMQSYVPDFRLKSLHN